jgi:hypothetical protein
MISFSLTSEDGIILERSQDVWKSNPSVRERLRISLISVGGKGLFAFQWCSKFPYRRFL